MDYASLCLSVNWAARVEKNIDPELISLTLDQARPVILGTIAELIAGYSPEEQAEDIRVE